VAKKSSSEISPHKKKNKTDRMTYLLVKTFPFNYICKKSKIY